MTLAAVGVLAGLIVALSLPVTRAPAHGESLSTSPATTQAIGRPIEPFGTYHFAGVRMRDVLRTP